MTSQQRGFTGPLHVQPFGIANRGAQGLDSVIALLLRESRTKELR